MQKLIILSTLMIILVGCGRNTETVETAPLICNGYAEFCTKSYAEMTFATTHNANVSRAYQLTALNQTNSLTKQLDDGIRALMLDISYFLGTPYLCHGNNACTLGWLSTANGFGEIKTWLDANPKEVVTLIFESYVEAADLKSSLDDAELLDYAFVPKDINAPDWSTQLGDMIATQKRLVIFTVQAQGYTQEFFDNYTTYMNAGLLNGNYYLRQNSYSGKLEGNWDCDCVDGKACDNATSQLYIVNHFQPGPVGTGDITNAGFVNRTPSVLTHAKQCLDTRGRVNFIATDFYETGAGSLVAPLALSGIIADNSPYDDQYNCRNDYQCWERCDTFCVTEALYHGPAGAAACTGRSFFDPREGGQCWECPEGTNRTLFPPVTADNACDSGPFTKAYPATLILASTECNKHYTSTSFEDPNGNCYDCKGNDRTLHPVTDWNACVEPPTGDPNELDDISEALK